MATRVRRGADDGGDVTLPNLITIARIFCVPFIVWLIVDDRMAVALSLFLLAGLSDAVDGFLAKHFDLASELGGYLDPLADKALLVSTIATLGILGHVPSWFVIAVVSRDVLIVGAVLVSWLVGRSLPIRPLFVSKLTTLSQLIAAGLVLGTGAGLGAVAPLVGPAVTVAAAMTALSAGVYCVDWIRHMAGADARDGGAGTIAMPQLRRGWWRIRR